MRTICKCGSFAINDDPEHERCDVCWRDDEIERLRELLDNESCQNASAKTILTAFRAHADDWLRKHDENRS
jgi:hypothetical protein